MSKRTVFTAQFSTHLNVQKSIFRELDSDSISAQGRLQAVLSVPYIGQDRLDMDMV